MSEEWSLKIDLAELRVALDRVLEQIEQTNGNVVSIPEDYFWSVPGDAIFDVTTQPELSIGQLTESWDNLEGQRAGEKEGTVNYHAVWLGELLTALGHLSKP